MTRDQKTMKQEWDFYVQEVYPGGCCAAQERETRQAFYSGAMVAFQAMAKFTTTLPKHEAVKAFDTLYREAKTTCESMMKAEDPSTN